MRPHNGNDKTPRSAQGMDARSLLKRAMRYSTPFVLIGVLIELTSVFTTIISGYLIHHSAQERAQLQFDRQIERGMMIARNRLEQYEKALHASAGLFNASHTVTRSEWTHFVEKVIQGDSYPGVSGFGFIRRVPETQLDSFLASARADHAPDFKIRLLDVPPPGDRYIIDYIEPLARNFPARGLDIGSDTTRRAAADAAMNSGQARITNIITLVQDSRKKPGFLMLVPLYEGGETPATVEERRAKCLGWTYAPFVGEAVMAGISDIIGGNIVFSIYDGKRTSERRIYDGIGTQEPDREGERVVDVGGQQWRFVWGNIGGLSDTATLDRNSRWIVGLGLVTSTGLLAVMLLLHRANREAMRRAEEASRAKSEFLAVMSHEIRTPLNGVLGMTELLREESLTPAVRDQVEVIHRSGTALLSLVNDILDYSRIEEGRLDLEHAAFDLVAQVTDSAALFRDRVASRGVQLIIDVPPGPVWVIGDPLRFRQIVLNLIGNAVKFTSDGSITIQLEGELDRWRLSIADTGIGMDDGTLARLFQPFTQAESSTSRRFGGSGLGLSIVGRLVQLMSGTIAVHSRKGHGSRFEVILPLPVCSAPANNAREMDAAPQFGLTVLLAEDNVVNQRIATAMLHKLGCTVILATDGEQAVRLAMDPGPGQRIDVILMDWHMPELDGLQATAQLRERGFSRPIIALTANASTEDRATCAAAGMDDFLTKPIRLKALREALKTVQDGETGRHTPWVA